MSGIVEGVALLVSAYSEGYEAGKAEMAQNAITLAAALVKSAGGRIEVPDNIVMEGNVQVKHWRDERLSCEVWVTRNRREDP
jgi:hypothetical protein